MQLNLRSILFFLLFTLTVSATATASQYINMANKNVIVQFKKSSTAEDRQKIVSDLKGKGATIVNDDNLDSKIFPFITVSVTEDSFSGLQSDFGSDHDVVDNVEADQEMRIQ